MMDYLRKASGALEASLGVGSSTASVLGPECRKRRGKSAASLFHTSLTVQRRPFAAFKQVLTFLLILISVYVTLQIFQAARRSLDCMASCGAPANEVVSGSGIRSRRSRGNAALILGDLLADAGSLQTFLGPATCRIARPLRLGQDLGIFPTP